MGTYLDHKGRRPSQNLASASGRRCGTENEAGCYPASTTGNSRTTEELLNLPRPFPHQKNENYNRTGLQGCEGYIVNYV